MKIKRIHHAAIRLIFKLPLKNHSSITMRQNVGILNTITGSKFKLLCIIHKTLLYNTSVNFRDILAKKLSKRSLRSTTDQHRLRFEMGNGSVLSKRALLYISPEICNSLPITIRSTRNHRTFKTALKSILFQKRRPILVKFIFFLFLFIITR